MIPVSDHGSGPRKFFELYIYSKPIFYGSQETCLSALAFLVPHSHAEGLLPWLEGEVILAVHIWRSPWHGLPTSEAHAIARQA